MSEPSGPLSPTVYWRRRALAMAGAVVAGLLFIWAIGALLGGSGSPATRNASNEQPAGVPLTVDPSGSQRASNPPSNGRLAGSSSSSASASSSAGSSASRPAGQLPTTTAPVPTTTTPPPGPPGACPDTALRVSATATKPSAPSGAHVTFTLHIANAGPVACVRDVSRQLRALQLVPAAGGAPVWSSADCYTLHTNEAHTFQPGQEITYTVTWAGRTSAPGCPVGRGVLPAGRYGLVGRLGAVVGAPTPFAIT